MKSLCSLIPSYNEAKTIGAIIKRLRERNFTVYVVDDGSTDGTSSISEREGAIVIRNKKNLGKGAALRAGFERVLADGHDMVIIMDGDDQHDIDDIAHLIMKMRETNAGLVIGNRMCDLSSMPPLRVFVNRFMSYVISKMAGQYVPDTQCGFRLIKSDVLAGIRLESSNYEIESEMIIKTARAAFKIESVPIKTVYQNERSKINPVIDTARFIKFVAKVLWKR